MDLLAWKLCHLNSMSMQHLNDIDILNVFDNRWTWEVEEWSVFDNSSIVQLGLGLGTGRMCAEYRQRSAYAAAKWAQSHKYGIKLFSIYWMEVFRLQIEPLCMQYCLCIIARIKSQYRCTLLHILHRLTNINNCKPSLCAFHIPPFTLSSLQNVITAI